MGAHYHSTQVRGRSQEAVVAALEAHFKEQKGKALVGPQINGWTAIYLDDSVLSNSPVSTLARQLNTLLDLLVHDSDIFAYSFYEGDRLRDEYSSAPDYFEEVSPAQREQLRGNSEAFREILVSDEKVRELAVLLKEQDSEEFDFEENRLERFARLFGINNALTSYAYLTNGEWDGIKNRRQFVHVPDLTAEKTAVKAAAAALRAEIKRLKKERILCFESLPPNKHTINPGEAIFDPVQGGVLFKWGYHATNPDEPRLLYVKPPWTAKPEAIEVPAGPVIPHNLVFSRTGKWLAYSDGQLRLWNWTERRQTENANVHLFPVRFSSDERFLLCQTQQRFEMLELETNTITSRIPAHPHFLAWHPAGKFLVTRPQQDQLGLIDLELGTLTKTLYSGTVSDWSNLAPLFSGELQKAGISDAQLNEMKQGLIRGSDQPFSIKFSPDGRLMFCATTRGLRVLEWGKVLAAQQATPPPLFTASAMALDSPLKPFERKDLINYIYDVVLDEHRNRLLFGGIEGVIRFFDLDTERTGILFKPPGGNYIRQIHLSPNREFICCHCTPSIDDRNKKPHRIQVWNYRLLAAAAGLDF